MHNYHHQSNAGNFQRRRRVSLDKHLKTRTRRGESVKCLAVERTETFEVVLHPTKGFRRRTV